MECVEFPVSRGKFMCKIDAADSEIVLQSKWCCNNITSTELSPRRRIMLWCDQPKNIGDDKKAPCGSSNVKIIVESKYSVVYHCSDCRRNSIIVKDVKNARN